MFVAINRPQAQAPRIIKVKLFWSIECPVAEKYTNRINQIVKKFQAKGVSFEGIFTQEGETDSRIRQILLNRNHRFTWHRDPKGEEAFRLGVSRIPAAIVLGENNEILYSGAIDDSPEGDRVKTKYLETALDSSLKGVAPAVRLTQATGCLVMPEFNEKVQEIAAKYDKVRAFLVQECTSCHANNGAAPFKLDNYVDARRWAPMIAEVLSSGKMPPYGMKYNIQKEMFDAVQDWRKAGRPGGSPEPKIVQTQDLPSYKIRIPAAIAIPVDDIEVKKTIRLKQFPRLSGGRFRVVSQTPRLLRSIDLYYLDVDKKKIWLTSYTPNQDYSNFRLIPKNTEIVAELLYFSGTSTQADQPYFKFFESKNQLPKIQKLNLAPTEIADKQDTMGATVRLTFVAPTAMKVEQLRLNHGFGMTSQLAYILDTEGNETQLFNLAQLSYKWPIVRETSVSLKKGDKIKINIFMKDRVEIYRKKLTPDFINLDMAVLL